MKYIDHEYTVKSPEFSIWTEEQREFAIAEFLCNCRSVFKEEGGPQAHQVECAYTNFCKQRYIKLQELYPVLLMA